MAEPRQSAPGELPAVGDLVSFQMRKPDGSMLSGCGPFMRRLGDPERWLLGEDFEVPVEAVVGWVHG